MRRTKGSHRIEVGGVKYRWRATGDDGFISIGIWPSNDIGAYLHGTLDYHETWLDNGDGSLTSARDQIVITNRIVRRVTEHAVAKHSYDPNAKAGELNLFHLEKVIKWDDAVRAGVTRK